MSIVPFIITLLAGTCMSTAVIGNDCIAVVDDEPIVVKVEVVAGEEPNVVVQTIDATDKAIYSHGDGTIEVKAIVLDGEGGTNPIIKTFVCKDGDVSGKGKTIIVDGNAIEIPGGAAGALGTFYVSAGMGKGIEAGGPWLGIQFGPVSKPLMSHLNLDEDVGQMILNVVESSPADVAELELYDVIVSIDGGEVSSSIAEFMDIVRDFESGESVVFGMIRGGQGLTSNLIVGTRPETTGETKYKYETTIEELTDGQEFFRGGWLKKGEGGKWMFNNFDQKDVVDVWKMMPNDFDWSGSGSSMLKLYNSPQSSSLPYSQFKTFVWNQGDAESIRIETKDDGQIVVIRTEKDDNGDEVTTTKIYADEDELRNEDPDAANMVDGKNLKFNFGKTPYTTFNLFGGDGGKDFLLNCYPSSAEMAAINLDSDRLLEKINEALEQSDALKGTLNADDLRDRILEKINKVLEQSDALKGTVDGDDLRERLKVLEAFTDWRPQMGGREISSSGKVVVSFMLDETGKIRVTTREGDAEITHVFEDAKAMQDARPDLFGKYNRLHSGDRTKKTPKRK